MTEHVSILTHGGFFLGPQIAEKSAHPRKNEASRLVGEDRAGRFGPRLCPRLERELQSVLDLTVTVLENGVDLAIASRRGSCGQDLCSGGNVRHLGSCRIAINRALEVDRRVQNVV